MTEKLGPLGPTGDAWGKEARCPVCGQVKYGWMGCGPGAATGPDMLANCYKRGYERLLSERKGLRAEAFEEAARLAQDCSDGGALDTSRFIAALRALAATSAPQDNPKVTK